MIDRTSGRQLVKDLLARFPHAVSSLPRELAERLWETATLVNAKSGRTILSLGAQSTNVYLVVKGRVQVTLFSLGGREVILRDLGEGEIFGELAALDDRPRSASIVALSDCVLASIGADAFRRAVFELPLGAMWLARRLTGQIRDLTEKVFELNALRVRSRLHCELLRMCGSAEGGGVAVIDSSPTHAELASRIGTHREAVTREMGFLMEQGIVEQQRRRLAIVDVAALAQLVRLAGGEIDPALGYGRGPGRRDGASGDD
jgi:CRP/FNR family transcriptional regulator, cyclic AMP receptor protein